MWRQVLPPILVLMLLSSCTPISTPSATIVPTEHQPEQVAPTHTGYMDPVLLLTSFEGSIYMNDAQAAINLLHDEVHFSGEWVMDDQETRSEVEIQTAEGMKPMIDLWIQDEALCVPHDIQVEGQKVLFTNDCFFPSGTRIRQDGYLIAKDGKIVRLHYYTGEVLDYTHMFECPGGEPKKE